MRATFLILVFSYCYNVYSQNLSNYREKTFAVRDTVFLDSLSIVPGSVQINNIDSSSFELKFDQSLLIWKKGQKPESDSIKISYRVFPLSFSQQYFHKDISKIEKDAVGTVNPFSYTVEKNTQDFLSTPGLTKQGSISRGISFGNNQDLSVNSNLNLQLSGKLSDNLNVLAAITDDNIPIQPEGNSQQLQEFDQVYIQLYNEKARLTAGDFPLKSNESYFMKYFKKARGINLNYNTFTSDKKPSQLISASGAVSRGKFARNNIQGIEANQGPYRLKGAENESFIIILSGTERVFMDGELLLRGQENDYVIDYNTAEITFTAKRLVTKDRRIIVEFQYSEKNYARSLFQFSDEVKTSRMKLRFSIYSEQDSKNQPLQMDLSDEQKLQLAQAGDSLHEAVSENIEYTGFSDIEVRYKLVDTLGYDSVFVYSTHPDSAVFRLGFSNVGSGNGNYIQVASSANGRVFQWVAPDTAEGRIFKNGSYEPLVQLISPKKKQMAVFGGEYLISKNNILSFELAGSNNDLNTFSQKHSGDDQGYAGKFNINSVIPVGSANDSNWNIIATAGYEQLNKNFSYIEWFRPAEFDRDWNLTSGNFRGNSHIPEAGIGLEKKNVGNVRYLFNSYLIEPLNGSGKNDFEAFKHNILSSLKTRGFDLDFNGSLLNSRTSTNQSEFLRNKSAVKKRFKYFSVGGRTDFENNLFTDPVNAWLMQQSYRFFEWELFLANADSAKNRYIISYNQRKDYAVQNAGQGNSSLQESTLGEFLSFSYEILKHENAKLRGKSTYRKLNILDSTLSAQKPDNTLLNRIEYNWRVFRGAISLSSFYEIGSGLEVKKEFSFIEVPAGQGVYAWQDYNGNGIKELNEFEISAFPDQALYIKLYVPTNEFIKTFNNQFNQTVFIQPAAIWNNSSGLRKLISKFSDQFAYRIERKTTREDQETAYNPFIENIADSSLMTLNSSLRNTFYFNRSHPEFGLDYNYQDSKNKTLLVNGFESRRVLSRELSMRWNFADDFLFNLIAGEGIKTNSSEFFDNRNFKIDHYRVQPKLSFQPGTTYRISLLYEYLDKENKAEAGGEKALNQKSGAEVKLNSAGKGSILGNFNFIRIAYSGESNSPLAFEMLEGLMPGNNYTWSISWQHTLANNLQLSLNYNGRSTEKSKVIHSGGVQLRAFF